MCILSFWSTGGFESRLWTYQPLQLCQVLWVLIHTQVQGEDLWCHNEGYSWDPYLCFTGRETTKFDKQEYKGTANAEVLKGDYECPDLMAAYIYGTKSVYFLSMAFQRVKSLMKKKRVWE